MPQSTRFYGIHRLISEERISMPGVSSETMVPVYVERGRVRTQVNVLEAAGFDLRVLSTVKIPAGSEVRVITESGFPASESTFPGVVHNSRSGTLRTECGIVLSRRVPPELELMCNAGLRINLRFQCCVSGEVQWGNSEARTRATVLNYSRHGVCLRSDTVAIPGEPFRFFWDHQSVRYSRLAGGSQCVLGTVRWATGEEGLSLAGCELTRSLGYVMSGIDDRLLQEIQKGQR